MTGSLVIAAFVLFNPSDMMHQADDPGWQQFRARDTVTGQPIAFLSCSIRRSILDYQSTILLNKGALSNSPQKCKDAKTLTTARRR